MQIGIGPSITTVSTGGTASHTPDPLSTPRNLFSPSQATFSQIGHITLRANWTVAPGDLRQISGNGNQNDVRFTFDTPLTAGHPHIALWQAAPGTTGTYRGQFGGSGSRTGNAMDADETRPKFQWVPGADMAGAYTRFGFNPLHDDMDAQVSEVSVYDLSSTDPLNVACDVVLCLGDSIMSNATSETVSDSNLTIGFDPRVWYMPCLRSSPNQFAYTSSYRHIPQPCIEPVQASGGANKMSPLMAFGAGFADWSAARRRPLLLLSLGDPGSGLNGSEDWRKTSNVAGTGARMYGEMLDMLTALQALGPSHEIVGAIVSLGTNDPTGADYNTSWVPHAQAFISNLRSEPQINHPTLPIAWLTPGDHYEPTANEDRGARMIAAIESLDQDSGSPNAVNSLSVVRPATGNALTPGVPTDPHFNAAGQQANGHRLAAALREMM